MDVYEYPSRSFSSASSSSMASSSPILSWSNLVERLRNTSNFTVSAIIGSLFTAIFVFFFALVGTLLGAMTGALIGQETESGFIRGAAIGAISGAVFSLEVFESSVILWRSDETGIGCLLYLIDVITSLLSGRLVRERIGPAMLSAVQSQVLHLWGPWNQLLMKSQASLRWKRPRGCLATWLRRSPRSKSPPMTMWMLQGKKFLAPCACRTSKSEKRFEACLIVTTCFTFLA